MRGGSNVSKELEFFLFLIENYADYKDKSTGEILREWDEHNITQEIYDGYPIYHQEALTNAYMDIDQLITTGEHAY